VIKGAEFARVVRSLPAHIIVGEDAKPDFQNQWVYDTVFIYNGLPFIPFARPSTEMVWMMCVVPEKVYHKAYGVPSVKILLSQPVKVKIFEQTWCECEFTFYFRNGDTCMPHGPTVWPETSLSEVVPVAAKKKAVGTKGIKS